MSTKSIIQKVLAEVEAHEERGWLKGYEEGLAKREQQIVDLEAALEAKNQKIRELNHRKKAPKTAREALALAWELAHPLKEGQVIPVGTEYFYKNAHKVWAEEFPFKSTSSTARNHRTLDPLPEPEPDWLDAQVVIARVGEQTAIFTPAGDNPDRWTKAVTGTVFHWTELEDVTPFYPKEDA